MTFKAEDLPFLIGDLEPFISEKTMKFHYEKHYKNYILNLNELTKNMDTKVESLKSIMLKNVTSHNMIFNNAAQAWNHAFFWKSLDAKKVGPSEKLEIILCKQFGSMENLKDLFIKIAISCFGSGWIWIIKDLSGELNIIALNNADNPICNGQIPLLVCDVWEHAYYLDYQNDRTKYLNQYWQIINWSFLEQNLIQLSE